MGWLFVIVFEIVSSIIMAAPILKMEKNSAWKQFVK